MSQDEISLLLSLSTEILLKIFQHLEDPKSVLRLGSTCTRLAAIARDDLIWRPLVLYEHPLIAKFVVGPAGDLREGWEDLVNLFGGLAVEEEDNFVTWHEAYRQGQIPNYFIQTLSLQCCGLPGTYRTGTYLGTYFSK